MRRHPAQIIVCLAVAAVGAGCVARLSYRPPPLDTPAASVSISDHPSGFVRFDVFHALEACPGRSRAIWNSEYLGTLEVAQDAAFRIPGNGYVRLIYHLGGGVRAGGAFARSYTNYRGELVLETTPGAAYVISATSARLRLRADSGVLRQVRCDGRTPIPATPSPEP